MKNFTNSIQFNLTMLQTFLKLKYTLLRLGRKWNLNTHCSTNSVPLGSADQTGTKILLLLCLTILHLLRQMFLNRIFVYCSYFSS